MLALSLVFVHILAAVIWIGSILAVATVLTSRTGDAKTRGELGAEIYKKLAVPAFIAAFAAGAARLALTVPFYFTQTKFMHGKLLFALIVIALHHVIGARAKKMASGAKPDEGSVGTFAAVLLLAAAATAFFAVLKPF